MIGNPYSSRHLRPAHQAAALSFVDAQIIGIVSEKDKTELALLAARIPTLSWAKKIDSIQVLWPEHALVAKLSINTARIYCAKNWEGVWEIIEVNEYVP